MGGIIRELQPDDSLRGIKLGDEAFTPLKTFLCKCAVRFNQNQLARTYVVVDDPNPKKVIAYLTLVCSEIQNSFDANEDHQEGTRNYKSLPAIKLARMAVDTRWRGGVGKIMMDWCLAHVIGNVMPYVGCRFLVVDSKKQSVGFYKKMGFTLLDTPENKNSESPVMFIDLYKTRAYRDCGKLRDSEQQSFLYE